mgnify:CR=1 FL=1
MGETVVKFHHTLTSILQGLLQAGFTITNVIEPQPTKEMLQQIKDMEEELQKVTDKFVKKVDEAVEAKSKEVMTV